MRNVIRTGTFRKSYKHAIKRGKRIEKLDKAIALLIENGQLPRQYSPHKLVGNHVGLWECHLEPDWLLVYTIDETTLTLEDTGTHSDLF